MEHWFWLFLCFVTLVWYAVVTIIVGIKGAQDIKHMIGELYSKENL